MSLHTAVPTRAFVLGLDGVPWDLLHDWIDEGDLPNLQRLMTEGAAGPLRSTVPPTTPLAWPSIATGSWPDKHGVYGFQHLSGEYVSRMFTSRDIQQPELWDILSPAVVGNVPMSYPAAQLDGKMVTGMMTPAMNDRFTHPPELASTVVERVPNYRIGLQWSNYTDRTDEFLVDLEDMVAARRELMQLLMETDDWRLFFFVYTAPDRLQHLIWDESTLLDHYRLLDEIVGEAMDYAHAHDAVLFVVSDHGFGPISKVVYVNRLLEEHGYLVRKNISGTRGVFGQLNVSRQTVRSFLKRVGVSEHLLLKYLPQSVIDSVATAIPGNHALFDVDHTRTKAFMFGSGSVFINDSERFADGIVDPSDVAALKDNLSSLLTGLTDPDTGSPVLEVYDGANLFREGTLVPDLVIEPRDGYEKMTSLKNQVFESSSAKGTAASHRPEGVLLAWGPSIEAGGAPVSATVVDVAPTVLHALGEPIGSSMDGRVLVELFDPRSRAATAPPETFDYEGGQIEGRADADTSDDYGDVEERLRGLGYLE